MRVGVDVVDLPRMGRALTRWGELLTGRILTPAETCWCQTADRPEIRVAACFAVKESLLKVLRRKPPSFSWKNIEIICYPEEPSPPLEIRLLADALKEEAGLKESYFVPCRLQGSCLVLAEELLDRPKGTFSGLVWAFWGWRGGQVLAVALLK